MGQKCAFRRREVQRDHGFTLFEVLTALVVMGVATSIFIALYMASLDLARTSRGEKAAALIAEEHLAEILAHPSAYQWPDGEIRKAGERHPLAPLTTELPPAAMPTEERAYNRDKNFYEGFTWEAMSRLPSPDAQYFEILMIVTWRESGRDNVFTLTSSVARALAEDAA